MFHTVKNMLAILIFSCFFQDAQADWNRQQLENKLSKPVFSYQYVDSFGCPLDYWMYTTQLSKILLVGDHYLFEFVHGIPLVENIGGTAELIFNNRFTDTRFESFVGKVGKCSLQELQEAIQDAIMLSQCSTQGYSIRKLLDSLIDVLQKKISLIQDQMNHNFKYDQTSLHSMKKSMAWLGALFACGCLCNTKMVRQEIDVAILPYTLAGVCLLKALHGGYKCLITDPNAYNKHLDEYRQLLDFVQNLQKDLLTSGVISFTLANQCRATITVKESFFGEAVGLDFEN